MQASLSLLFFKTIAVFIAGVFFFSFFQSVFAVAPTITSFPSTINNDMSFTLSATMSGLSNNAVYRLRIALAQPGTSTYFGSTYNGGVWYNGTPSPINYSNFLSITTDGNGTWFGDILGMVQSSDTNFTTGSGTYDLKVGRYTENGTSATWSNIASVSLVAPTPTPTVSPTATPEPTVSSTPTPTFSPTNTLTPTKIPATPTPIIKSTVTSTPKVSANPTITFSEEATASESVLAVTTENNMSSSSSEKREKKELIASANAENNISKILIGLGIVFLLVCGILATDLVGKVKDKFRQVKE